MKLIAVYFSIIVYSVMVPNIAKAEGWQKYQPRPWHKITIEQIKEPINENQNSDIGSVVNVLEKRKAFIPPVQCNKKTAYGNWIPAHCGKQAFSSSERLVSVRA